MNSSPENAVTRKTAILLLSLEQELAAELLGKLSREQVEQMTLAIANTANVTREEQEAVLNEFKVAFSSRPLIQPAGPETARELLQRTLDQSDIEPAARRVEIPGRQEFFAFLNERHPDDIRVLLETEHPQTIAVVSAHLPPELSAQVLARFGIELQTDILARVARLGPTDSELLDEISKLLEQRAGRAPVRAGGITKAAEVLRESGVTTRSSVLQTIAQQDIVVAGQLRDTLFAFSDLQFLNTSDLKLVLAETDELPWSIALKGASETLRQQIFAALHPGMVQALRDSIRSAGPVRLSEITMVQRNICNVVLRLEMEDRIQLPRRNSIHGKVGAA